MPPTDPIYREWVRHQPCLLRGQPGHVCRGAVQACHYRTRRNNGDPSNLYPGCDAAHREQHQYGIRTFQDNYNVDLDAYCADLYDEYVTHHQEREESIPRW